MINPPAAALPLVEAFHRFTDPELLAPLNGRLPPGRWYPHSGGPASRAINGFFERLHRGELTCWARHESPVAPYRPIPAAAWAHLQIRDWRHGVLEREEWRPAVVTRPRMQLTKLGGSILVSQGAPVQETRNRPCIVERWFDALVTPAQPGETKRKTHNVARGYKATDAPLVAEMDRLIEQGSVSRWQAALAVADRARGGGTHTSKAKRLWKSHKEWSEKES